MAATLILDWTTAQTDARSVSQPMGEATVWAPSTVTTPPATVAMSFITLLEETLTAQLRVTEAERRERSRVTPDPAFVSSLKAEVETLKASLAASSGENALLKGRVDALIAEVQAGSKGDDGGTTAGRDFCKRSGNRT